MENSEKNKNKKSDNKDYSDEPYRHADSIEDFGALAAENPRESVYCLSIIGQIEGHYFLPEGAESHQVRAYNTHACFG